MHHNISYATPLQCPSQHIMYNANQTLQTQVGQPPSKYQANQQYPYDFNEPMYPVLHEPHYYPYEYEEAMREAAKKMRLQEQQQDSSVQKPYRLPNKPYKPEYIDIEEFASIFREMVMYEVKCEALRVQLALQPDFRIPVLWRIFDRAPKTKGKQQNDFIGLEDFIKGSRAFSVDSDPIDIKLLMSKYKNVGGGSYGAGASHDKTATKETHHEHKTNFDYLQLDYQEFFAIFYPLSKGDIFDQKLNTQDTDSDRFFYRTNMLIERLLRMMLSQEDAFEYFRREIVRKGIDLNVVFKKINVSRDKRVNADELRLFLIDYGLAVTKEDLMLFLMRLDKENTGTFGQDDFLREFTPRLSLKR